MPSPDSASSIVTDAAVTAIPETACCNGDCRTWSRDLLILGLLCLVWFCATLGVRALNNPDEGRYVEIPREMAETGDYVTPRLNGVKYFEKPPLLYWLSAATFEVAGVNPFTARLWNALFAVAGVLATYCAARALHGRFAGWCSAVVLATSLLYFGLSQIVLLDMAVAVTMAGALLAFLLAVRMPPGKGRRLLFWIFYACMALAVLAKGLIGFVLPCAVAFVWLLCLNQWRSLRPCHPFSGAFVLLAIAAPWHVLATLQNHSTIKEHDFAWFYFVHEHYLRFTTTVHRREQPWWFFGPVFVAGLFPWVVFAIQSLKDALAGGWRMRAASREAWFLVIWIVLIMLFFSKSQSKLIPYILPVFPAAAILIGSYLARAWAAPQAAPGLRRGLWTFAIAALVLAICAVAVPAPRKYADLSSLVVVWRWVICGVLAAGSLVMIRGLLSPKMRQGRGGQRVLLLVMAASFGVVLALFNPIARNFNPRTTREIALALKPVLAPGDSVYCLGYYQQDLPVYLNRLVSVVDYKGELGFGIRAEPELTASRFIDREAFHARWEQPAIAYAVVSRQALDKWFPDPATRSAILAESPRFVLVANRHDFLLDSVRTITAQ